MIGYIDAAVSICPHILRKAENFYFSSDIFFSFDYSLGTSNILTQYDTCVSMNRLRNQNYENENNETKSTWYDWLID